MFLDQQKQEKVTVLTGVIPNYQGEIRLLLYNIGKEESIWNIRGSIDRVFLPCSVSLD